MCVEFARARKCSRACVDDFSRSFPKPGTNVTLGTPSAARRGDVDNAHLDILPAPRSEAQIDSECGSTSTADPCDGHPSDPSESTIHADSNPAVKSAYGIPLAGAGDLANENAAPRVNVGAAGGPLQHDAHEPSTASHVVSGHVVSDSATKPSHNGDNGEKLAPALRRYMEHLDTSYTAPADFPTFDDPDVDFEIDDNEFAPVEDDEDASHSAIGGEPSNNATPNTSARDMVADTSDTSTTANARTRPPVPRPTLPSWLADEYAETSTKGSRPACYESGQFMMTAHRSSSHTWYPGMSNPATSIGHNSPFGSRTYFTGSHARNAKPLAALTNVVILWSPAVMDSIPPPIKAKFPFHLTHRFAAAHRPFPRWNDLNRYADYVPTHKYFSAFYNRYIKDHTGEIDQQMFMQSAEQLNEDHSFKVPRRLGNISGVAAFSALHSAVNDDCMPALAKIPKSLAQFGHSDVQVVYTDNVRGDKDVLERIFPSLLRDVTPIPTSLTLPDGWGVYVLSSTYQINSQLNSIMEDLRHLETEQELHIAVDMEWPVDRATGIYGRVAVVSMAYKQSIYIIPLANFIHDDGFLKLPCSLLVFMRSVRIRKLGVHVKADLTRLFNDCGFATATEQPFVGALELGVLAKQQNITDCGNIGLSDLTAAVLRRYLVKDTSVRVSTNWNNPTLTQEQIDYAALDVYASWAIFESFLTVPVPGPVTAVTSAGTHVKLLSRDGKTVVALGFISWSRPPKHDGINVTKTRAIIQVTSIVVPAYLAYVGHDPVNRSPPTACPVGEPPSTIEPYISDLVEEPVEDEDYSTWPDSLDYDAESEQHVSDAVPDVQGLQQAQLLGHLTFNTPDGEAVHRQQVRSRVIGDPWHGMDQFKIPVHHGLRQPFARALRDALFLPDLNDKSAVERVLAKRNTTYQMTVLHQSDWVWQRVKRFIPPPEVLTPRVLKVLQTFGPLKDAVTGQPLFNDASWKKAKNYIENIRMGYFSDPPGVKLYRVLRTDAKGLTVYRCTRGTNSVKGGVHQNIIRRFGTFNASPRFAVNLLRDYCLHHNLKLIDLTTCAFRPTYHECGLIDWQNVNDFAKTTESFGILPLSDDVQKKLGMLCYHPDYAHKHRIPHQYLAKKQGTRMAVLPVHTVQEKALFRLLMKNNTGHFTGRSLPNFLPEHLKSYHKTWNEHQNEANSIEQNKMAYDEIRKLVASPIDIPALPTAARTTIQAQIDSTCRPPPAFEPSDWHVGTLLCHNSSQQSFVQFQYGERPPHERQREGVTSSKQPAQDSQLGEQQAPAKKRRKRTCHLTGGKVPPAQATLISTLGRPVQSSVNVGPLLRMSSSNNTYTPVVATTSATSSMPVSHSAGI
ncbi:hypothetical protein BV22DRAFT_1051234 [Leucogyrophana mollusca]|uniref:Uncharacterized protein n=1 Tax=Leucogyrophana mollusca TaxID=85980 RepID=A0ACB8B0H1_9AGAM|nr:hypothetical protein BV22DRAFT_1051234 [Leucogyrophana mollusca]